MNVDYLLPDLSVINDGHRVRFRVKTVGRYHVEVFAMLVNWRVHTIPVESSSPSEWSARYWCYAGRTKATFVAAVTAAAAWDGRDDTEPAGWVKSWDGRYNEALLGASEHRTGGEPHV
jgi:hypothetical protein